MGWRSSRKEVSALRKHIVALARRLRQSANADGETWTRLVALGVIKRANVQATPTQVATELALKSSNAAQILNDLDRRGLVKRAADILDRRKVRLPLTAEGLDLMQVTREQRDHWLSTVMDESPFEGRAIATDRGRRIDGPALKIAPDLASMTANFRKQECHFDV